MTDTRRDVAERLRERMESMTSADDADWTETLYGVANNPHHDIARLSIGPTMAQELLDLYDARKALLRSEGRKSERCAFCGRRRVRQEDLPENLVPHRFVGANGVVICEVCVGQSYREILDEQLRPTGEPPYPVSTGRVTPEYAELLEMSPEEPSDIDCAIAYLEAALSDLRRASDSPEREDGS